MSISSTNYTGIMIPSGSSIAIHEGDDLDIYNGYNDYSSVEFDSGLILDSLRSTLFIPASNALNGLWSFDNGSYTLNVTIIPRKGDRGDQGKHHPDGTYGPDGDQGAFGASGDPGYGPNGSNGLDGAKGDDGQLIWRM